MKKILLLCQQHGCPIELSPARYQLIHELSKRDYEIYVFYPGRIRDKKIKEEIHYFTNTLNLSIISIRNKIIKVAPENIIAFTYEDTRILYPLQKIMKSTSFIYYNLEIYTPSMEQYIQAKGLFFDVRCGVIYLQNKMKEISFTKGCKIFIIQDKLRKKTSAKYFIHHPNTLLIPNSYTFHKEDEIGNERSGIIYSGGLNKLQLESLMPQLETIPDLPITFSGWSDDWFIVQFKKMKALNPSCKFYHQKLPPEKLSVFLKQYAVGFIWYSPIKDENINNIGLASGKLFKHLSLGQPVIVNESPGIDKVVEKYELGIVIRDASELKKAYEQIMKRYSYYQKNIRDVYENKFDYEKVVQPFLNQLEYL